LGTPVNATTASGQTQAHFLDACGLDIRALATEKGLMDVITQVESGQVEEIHKWYGPTHGSHGSSPEWKSVKMVMNKQE
jgi:hypothetical protein